MEYENDEIYYMIDNQTLGSFECVEFHSLREDRRVKKCAIKFLELINLEYLQQLILQYNQTNRFFIERTSSLKYQCNNFNQE